MHTVDNWIPEDQFAEFLRLMPQISIEIVVEHDGGLLLAKRTSDPGRGEWFWPGGRLHKGETFTAAVHRLADQELGIDVDVQECLGVQSQFWETDSHSGVENRHTVNIVYLVRPGDEFDISLDEQHSEYRFFHEIGDDHHQYVQRYVNEFELL